MRRRATCAKEVSVWNCREDRQPRWLADSRPSRAVSRNRNSGSQRVLGVEPDRFDHEVEFVGAVDLACYRVGHAGPEEQGFTEVIEPVNALRVEVPQQEHRTLPVFRPGEEEQMIGAEVEHARERTETSGSRSPRPWSAPLRGYPADSS